MRTLLMFVFWISNVGNVAQLLIIAGASWTVLSGTYSFSDLSLGVFVTEIVPWLLWLKTLILTLFGEFGRWLLSIPILVIAPVKLVTGTIIAWWAYTYAKTLLAGTVPA